MIPLRGDELDDRVLGLFQAGARFLDHQLMDLRHIGGGQVLLIGRAVLGGADHAGQSRFDVKQSARHIHQHRITGLALSLGQSVQHIQLIEDDLARLTKAQHRQGVGDLLERGKHALQIGHATAVAAHEQIEAVLDPYQLFAQGGHHRAHCIAVGTGHAGAFLVDHRRIRQGFIEAILLLEGTNTRRLAFCLGHVEQQVLAQLVRGALVEALGTLFDQALEFMIDLAQQGAHRGAVLHAAIGQTFDDARSDLPQRPQRGLATEAFQAGEHPRHVTQVGPQVLIADDPDQRHLQHLPQFAQQHRQLGGTQLGQSVQRQGFLAGGHIRGEQAGFREQAVATGGAQVVEQWQQHQRQVATGGLDAVQIDRQLQDGLHQHFQRLALVARTAFDQSLGQVLHFLGEQRRTVELDHLQGAEHLVHIGLAETQSRRILRILDKRFQGLARLFQGLGDFTFDPLQGDIVVPITHTDSAAHKIFRVNASTRSSATASSSGCCHSATSPTPITSRPPGTRRSTRRLSSSRRRQRRK